MEDHIQPFKKHKVDDKDQLEDTIIEIDTVSTSEITSIPMININAAANASISAINSTPQAITVLPTSIDSVNQEEYKKIWNFFTLKEEYADLTFPIAYTQDPENISEIPEEIKNSFKTDKKNYDLLFNNYNNKKVNLNARKLKKKKQDYAKIFNYLASGFFHSNEFFNLFHLLCEKKKNKYQENVVNSTELKIKKKSVQEFIKQTEKLNKNLDYLLQIPDTIIATMLGMPKSTFSDWKKSILKDDEEDQLELLKVDALTGSTLEKGPETTLSNLFAMEIQDYLLDPETNIIDFINKDYLKKFKNLQLKLLSGILESYKSQVITHLKNKEEKNKNKNI